MYLTLQILWSRIFLRFVCLENKNKQTTTTGKHALNTKTWYFTRGFATIFSFTREIHSIFHSLKQTNTLYLLLHHYEGMMKLDHFTNQYLLFLYAFWLRRSFCFLNVAISSKYVSPFIKFMNPCSLFFSTCGGCVFRICMFHLLIGNTLCQMKWIVWLQAIRSYFLQQNCR